MSLQSSNTPPRGKRQVSIARHTVWFGLYERGMAQAHIARRFAVDRATVASGIRAHALREGKAKPVGPRGGGVAGEMTPAEARVYSAICKYGVGGLSSRDLLQWLYPDGKMPASAEDCVRSCVTRIRRKLPVGLSVVNVNGRYRVRREQREAAE